MAESQLLGRLLARRLVQAEQVGGVLLVVEGDQAVGEDEGGVGVRGGVGGWRSRTRP